MIFAFWNGAFMTFWGKALNTFAASEPLSVGACGWLRSLVKPFNPAQVGEENLKLVYSEVTGDGHWALATRYGTCSCQYVLAPLAALWLWMWDLQAYQDESLAEQAACSPSLFPLLMDCRISERRPGAHQLDGGCSLLPVLWVSPYSSCCLAFSIMDLEGWLSILWSFLCFK